ncbi:hypothetical protein HI914_03596 [Erysiphe necator]|nr:hypothetical protein HI914_03596 [Erysiphe necator]
MLTAGAVHVNTPTLVTTRTTRTVKTLMQKNQSSVSKTLNKSHQSFTFIRAASPAKVFRVAEQNLESSHSHYRAILFGALDSRRTNC